MRCARLAATEQLTPSLCVFPIILPVYRPTPNLCSNHLLYIPFIPTAQRIEFKIL
jgi:hypothetical protein